MLASHQPLTQVQYLKVTSSHAGQRLDNFLLTFFKSVPKSHLYRIIRKGEVRVNKRRIDVSYRLLEGDSIRIPPIRFTPKEHTAPIIKPHFKQQIEEAICYEDDKLIVLNKPSGLAVHGGSGISLGLIEALRVLRPKASFLELVHRLDRDTSGCIMIAKRRSMLTYLHDCLKNGKIEKSYFALVKGRWQSGKQIEAPLHKYLLRSGERMVKVDPNGKFAQTNIKVLEFFGGATLLQASPVTGRTHQIRVHCTFKGHPIIGDQKYGDLQLNCQAKEDGFDRLFLHAHKLVVPLPDKPPLTVISPMPLACQKYIEVIKNREEL